MHEDARSNEKFKAVSFVVPPSQPLSSELQVKWMAQPPPKERAPVHNAGERIERAEAGGRYSH